MCYPLLLEVLIEAKVDVRNRTTLSFIPHTLRPTQPLTPTQELRDMIVRHPALLLSNVETTIKPKVSALFTVRSRIHNALHPRVLTT